MAQASRTTARTTAPAASAKTDEDKGDDVTDTQKAPATTGSESAAKVEKTDEEIEAEKRYPVDYWVTNSYVFLGQESGVVQGAFVHAKTKTLTKDQAEKLVAEHLDRPVAIEHFGTDEEPAPDATTDTDTE